MARNYDVITIGTARLDAFMTINDPKKELHADDEHHGICFRKGAKIIVDHFDFCMGGNAANVAVGLNRLGLKATLVAEIGDDEFSIKIRNMLAHENIERLFVIQTKGGSSNMSVIINFQDDRTIFAEERVQAHNFNLDEVESKYIYLTSLGREWEKAYKMSLEFANKNNSKIIFNPGSLQLIEGKQIVHQILKKTDILFINKEEGEMLLSNHYSKKVDNSENYIKNLCEEIQKLGPRIVIITNGKHGSYALTESGVFYEEGLIDSKVVERTGAGDAYASGFLSAIIYGENIEKAMKWGTHNAGSVVEQVGAQAGLLTKEEMGEKVK